MLKALKQNSAVPVTCKTGLLFCFLLSAFLSTAQDEENGAVVTDTTVVTIGPGDEVETEISRTEQHYLYLSGREDTLVVQQREVPGDAVKKMKADKDFWYADSAFKKKLAKEPGPEKPPRDSYVPLGQRAWFQTFLWIVILGVFIIGLTIYLRGSQVGLFRKKILRTAGTEEEEMTEDIFAINYQKEIDKAAALGNYRLAIRLLFLRLLKTMSEKNIIRYKQDKTNLDYLMELQQTAHYHHFFRITRNYEYSWYGQFPVSEDAWHLIRGDFEKMDHELI